MCFHPVEHVPCGVVVDLEHGTIRPDHPRGDDFFGLALGTNGTAAICRRQLAEAGQAVAAPLTWVRFNGEPATGVTCVPSADSCNARSPWEG